MDEFEEEVNMDEVRAGRAARDEGMALAERAEDEAWKSLADSVALELAWSGRPFSIDDVVERVGRPTHPNATGSVIMSLSRRGLIERVGSTPSRRQETHAHTNPLWQGTEAALARRPSRDTFWDL